MQRYLKLLCERLEIECDDSSKPYGYRWKGDSGGLAASRLSAQESLLLTLAKDHLQPLLPSSLNKTLNSFFEQAKRNLQFDDSAKRAREWQKKIRTIPTSQPLLPPTIRRGVFEIVSEALYLNRWLHIDYCSADNKRTVSDAMPLGLAQQGQCFYLIVRFRDFSDERALALHRIQAAQLSTVEFNYPDDFSLEDYDNDGRFGLGHGKHIRLSFEITPKAGRHLLESRLSVDQRAKHLNNGNIEIQATVVESKRLNWWLLSFGDNVTNIRRTQTTKATETTQP